MKFPSFYIKIIPTSYINVSSIKTRKVSKMQKFQKIDKFANSKKSEGKFYIQYVVLQRGKKARALCVVPYCSSLVQPLEQDYKEMTQLVENYIAEHLLEFSIDDVVYSESKIVIYNTQKQWLEEIQIGMNHADVIKSF